MAASTSQQAQATLDLSAGETPLPAASLHLMPFTLCHDGPAAISTYFLARPVEAAGQVDQEPQRYEAAFRGRYVHGTEVQLPNDFTGVLFSSPDHGSTSTTPALPTPAPPPAKKAAARGAAASLRGKGKGRISAAAAAAAARTGRRTSPRKSGAAVAKSKAAFSLDDDDSDEERERQAEAEALQAQGEEETAHQVKKRRTSVDEAVEAIWNRADEVATAATPPLTTLNDDDAASSVVPTESGSTLASTSVSTTLTMPSSSPPSTTSRAARPFKPVASFDRITMWKPDVPLDRECDIYAKTIEEWTGLAHLVRLNPWHRRIA